MPHISLHTTVGDLTVFESDGAIVAVEWGWARDDAPSPLLRDAGVQLNAALLGLRKTFDLPLIPAATAFQRRVRQALLAIPWGETRTYADLARALGTSARAVGQACARNPLPILVPCHRVLAQAGRLGGYSGGDGIDTKRALLRLEGALWIEEPGLPPDAS